jgi:hypothetical protein
MSESLPSFCSAYIKKSTTTSMLLRRRLTILTSCGLWAVLGVRNIENCPVEGVFCVCCPLMEAAMLGKKGTTEAPLQCRRGYG